MRALLVLPAIVCLSTAPSPIEAKDLSLTLVIFVAPSDGVTKVKMTDMLGDKTLADAIPQPDMQVTVSLANEYEKRTVFAVWRDQSQADFPLSLVPTLDGKKIEVYLTKVVVDPTAPDAKIQELLNVDCPTTPPRSIEAAFASYFKCRAWSRALDSGRHWQKMQRQALGAWLEANLFIYQHGSADQKGFDGYGIDRDLLDQVKAVIKAVDVDHYTEKSFAPINFVDARDFTYLATTEEVRLHDLVTQQLIATNLPAARALNEQAGAAYEALAGDSNKAIAGVDRSNLAGNSRYISEVQGTVPVGTCQYSYCQTVKPVPRPSLSVDMAPSGSPIVSVPNIVRHSAF